MRLASTILFSNR